MLTISKRGPTAEELLEATAPLAPWKAGVMVAALTAVPTALVAAIAQSLFRPLRPVELLGLWAALCVAGLTAMFVAQRKAKPPVEIEEWTVHSSRVVEVEPVGSDEPALCFDLGADGVLLLKGQWLRDGATYGAPEIDGDPPLEERISGREDPYGFPNTAFTVVVRPDERRVLAIRPSGTYLREQSSPARIPPAARFGQLERLAGSFDALQAALDSTARAAQR